MSKPALEENLSPPPAWAELATLIVTQNKLMRDMTAVLQRMEDKQAGSTADSTQPASTVPAISSSAWSPLLRSHLANIQPTVDRWRSTLDALLVFIAIFSAVVTAFFVQSLTTLSEDPGKRTNELLANLTDIIIILNGANASVLNFTRATPFKPETSDIRLNFYWSISLILSVLIASLALIVRGYVSMIMHTRHKHAYKKLTELHLRWVDTGKRLGRAVETLPHLLIVPGLVFLAGLLDNLITSSLPVSRLLVPILVAATISCILLACVVTYMLYTVIHGCVYHPASPFQSKFSSWLSSKFYGPAVPEPSQENYREAFYSTILSTYDDNVLDQAVPALESLLEEDRQSEPGPRNPSEKQIITFENMLSSEVSSRTNLAVATSISRTLVDTPYSRTHYKGKVVPYHYTYVQRFRLLDSLHHAARRYPVAPWSSPYITAMAKLLCCESSNQPHSSPHSVGPMQFKLSEYLTDVAPVLCVLLMPFDKVNYQQVDIDNVDFERAASKEALQFSLRSYAYDIFLSQLMDSHPNLDYVDGTNRVATLNAAMDRFMSSQPGRVQDNLRKILRLSFSGMPPASTSTHIPLLRDIHAWTHPNDDLPLQEALAHWIMNPLTSGLTKHQLVYGVEQVIAASMNDNLEALYQSPHSINYYTWIVFLCEELFSSVFQNVDPKTTTLYPRLLSICVNLALLALNSRQRLDKAYRHPEGDGAHCIIICQFKDIIVKLLGAISNDAPNNVRLDASTFEELSSAFNFERQERRYGAAWSTTEHRQVIKREIFAMFEHLRQPDGATPGSGKAGC